MPIIDVVKGDLLDMFDAGEFWAIGHGCNCFNTMGNGIAKQIKERYPEAYQADQNTKKGLREKLGSFTLAEYPAGDGGYKYIYNLYTQYTHWDVNDMLSLNAVRKCFETLDIYGYYGISYKPFGIPKIGAGLAMGDWDEISAVINEATPNLKITLVEWEPKVNTSGPDNNNSLFDMVKYNERSDKTKGTGKTSVLYC